jgi:ABC-2 type transport system ATP-binding protein
MYLQVDALGADAGARLASVPGVTRVTASEAHGPVAAFEVESEQGRDVRRELAAAVVGSGWGLLELRPLRISLEDVFLQLTTQEPTQAAAPAEGTDE